MGAVSVSAKALAAVFFVGVEVAFKPDDIRVTLKCEHMRCDPVKKPAVVRCDHRAATKRKQCFLKRAQCVHVQVVSWLVLEQEVAASLQELRQVNAVSLTTRERADLLLLV